MNFNELIQHVKAEVTRRLEDDEYLRHLEPEHIRQSTFSYIGRQGKSLRPVVLVLSSRAVGGDESLAFAAAASIEVYHTWTLVHDDIIDADSLRRGLPTVHAEFEARGIAEFGLTQELAKHYGLTMGILTGDVQQAWSISLMCDLHIKYGLRSEVVLQLLKRLSSYVQPTLVEGETLDVQYAQMDVARLDEMQILDMLWKKTGVLYEFAGYAGASIGLDDVEPHPYVNALAMFASKCGTAFQLKDDVLGVIGDTALLGKPVGSDIREGKRTTIVLEAMRKAGSAQRSRLNAILGNRSATDDEVDEARQLLVDLGGVDYTMRIASHYVEDARASLDHLPDSVYKTYLHDWGEYILSREQ
ncbi:MAG: polyprenyl synthetase family protein [Dehalococcoidia bacterium]